MQNFLDGRALDAFCEAACGHYEKTAPTVAAFADSIYTRISDRQPHEISLAELFALQSLYGVDGWEQPNYAANRIYKLQERLGQSTVGQAGF